VDNGFLQIAPNILNTRNKGIKRETCYALSNILADDLNIHDAVIDNNLIPILVEILAADVTEVFSLFASLIQ